MSDYQRNPNDVRWNVEVSKNVFEDVGAVSVEVVHGGALLFRDSIGRTEVIYAPGTWLTVTPQEN